MDGPTKEQQLLGHCGLQAYFSVYAGGCFLAFLEGMYTFWGGHP